MRSWGALVLATFVSAPTLSGCDRTRASSPEPTAPTDAAAAESPRLPDALDAKGIDDYVATKVQKGRFVGLSLAVTHHGHSILAKGYGESARGGAKVTPETSFAIGSVTKQLTAACILLLVDDGKLAVTDKVAKFYPELTRANDITLADLMSHMSGYRDFYPLDFIDRRMKEPTAPDDILHKYAGAPLDLEPGTRYSYSNTGYVLLGRIAEKASGESFGELLSRRILEPLGMHHTSFEPAGASLAQGYTSFALGPEEPAELEKAHWLYSAGGVYSTASDLATWDLALSGGKVLKPETYRVMTTPRTAADGRSTGYGFGVGISVMRGGETVLEHGGAVSGFLAYNAVIPRTQSAVVVLSNRDDADPGPIGEELVKLLLKDEAFSRAPHVHGATASDAARDLFHQLQSGKLDRANLGEELSAYLTEERLRGASARLKPLGEPTRVEIKSLGERGGMEVARIAYTLPRKKLYGSLYRRPDGRVEQFLVSEDDD